MKSSKHTDVAKQGSRCSELRVWASWALLGAMLLSGASTLAGEAPTNWVARLYADPATRAQALRMLGNNSITGPEVADFEAPTSGMPRSRLLGTLELPPVLDWRNRDGINWVTPVLNQGACGSCVAFSSVATLETQVNIASGIPGFQPRFSTQALFACGGGHCDFGWFPSAASRVMQSRGVPDEACAPYTMGATGETVKCDSICGNSAQRSLKIVQFTTPTARTRNIEALKVALARGPLVTSMLVYEDFLNHTTGVYRHTTGTSLGGHAVSIVGYDDTQRALIIRNSWGEEWGDKGFALVSYDDTPSRIGDETWQYEVPNINGSYVSITHPTNGRMVSGMLEAGAIAQLPGLKRVELKLEGDLLKTPRVMGCDASPCQTPIDTRDLPDGRYVLTSRAMGAGQEIQAQPRWFYVLNSKPTDMALSFTPKGFDLTRPLKDRVVFNIKAESKPVPMESVSFHVADSTGKEIFTRSTDVVVPGLIMGWRTDLHPDGQYSFWFTGRLKSGNEEFLISTTPVKVTLKQ